MAEAVSAWFGDHHVLSDVDLRMEAGQVTALIGPSGCGKSTFLRILNRMHELVPGAALAGQVLLDGEDIYDPARRPIESRRRIGMVFQKANPFPTMSVYDNVLAGLKLTGRKAPGKGGADGLVEQSLRSAGLWDEVKARLGTPGSSLSGGQQQRLCIARALAVRPDVLLMDEPCSALDPTSTRRVEETIRAIAGEVTIVIVTHNMQQAQRVSDRCAFFLAAEGAPGHIVEQGATTEVFEQPARRAHRRLRQRAVRMSACAPTTSRRRRRTDGRCRRAARSPSGRPARTGSSCAAPGPPRSATLVGDGADRHLPPVGALPALKSQGWSFLTEHEWLPEADQFGIAALLWGTIVIGLFALVVAVPVALRRRAVHQRVRPALAEEAARSPWST